MKELEQLVNDALIGLADPLKAMAEIKKASDKINKLKESILESAIQERDKYPEKELQLHGFVISKSSGGRYSYSHNNDWCELDNRRKAIEKKMQMAYKAGGSIIDEETGELFEPASYKANKKSLTFKYLK